MEELDLDENGQAEEQFACSECDFKTFSESKIIDHSVIHQCEDKQFIAVKESKTLTKGKVSQELHDYIQEDDYKKPEDGGDEDYKEEEGTASDSNDSQGSDNTKHPRKKYGRKNKTMKVATHEKKIKKRKLQYECSFCVFICPTAEMYSRHLRIHRGENPYSCIVCNERFQEKNSLKIHSNSVHNRELDYNIFACYHCEYKCKTLETFATHLLQHTHSDDIDSNPFVCSKCSKGFRLKVHLKKHMRKVHFDRSATKLIHCSVCDYTSFRIANMRDHMYIHTGEKPKSCPFCEYKCITASNMNIHLLIHTGEKKQLCNICGFKCTQKSSLKTHMKIHSNEKSYLCNECGYRSNTAGNLTIHMRTHTGEKKYLCTICGSKFTQSQSLKTHMNNVHSTYECSVCQKEFKEIGFLQTHMIDVHNCEPKFQKEKKFKCTECEKSFTQGHNLKLHKQKVHTNKKETEINKTFEFGMIDALDTHKNETSNIIKKVQKFSKTFDCTWCDKSFTQSHNLKTHMLKHTGDKPFACMHCSYCCTSKNNLEKHIRSKHLVNDTHTVRLKSESIEENGEQDQSFEESELA